MSVKCLLYSLTLITIIASHQPVCAQRREADRSHDAQVQELIGKLDSTDLHIANQAAYDLGQMRAKEAVPALLKVLQSSRFLAESRHNLAQDENSLSEWVLTDVRATIVNSLGQIGDRRAVPVLKKYLIKQPKSSKGVYAGTVAHALYMLTGKSYEYTDFEGKRKLYAPAPVTEEEVRMWLRPDLKPTRGLTSFLEIGPTGPVGLSPVGLSWVGSKPLELTLTITNHSENEIKLDASRAGFVFSCVVGSGERINVSASELPRMSPGEGDVTISPGGAITLKWRIGVLKESSLSRAWVGYVSVKCIYTNTGRNKVEGYWKGERLISNTVQYYYYAAI